MVRVFFIFLVAASAAAQTPALPIVPTNAPKGHALTVAWLSANDPTVAGYRIYSGSQSNWTAFTNVTEVGPQTSATLTNVIPPLWLYCVAYNRDGVESVPSNLAAWLGNTNDVLYYAEEADAITGPFRDQGLVLVKSNAPAGVKFTRLRIETKTRKVTLP